MKLDEIDFTLCTSVKNRDEHLEEVIPKWKELPFSRCIIVDWDSDIPVFENHGHLMDGRFTVIRVENHPKFISSVAHNFCINFVETEWVFRIDCDVYHTSSLLDVNIRENCHYLADYSEQWNVYGTSLFPKKTFEKSGGYDETQTEYGYEDVNFYKRLGFHKSKRVTLPKGALIHIEHDDDLRGKGRLTGDIHGCKYRMGRIKWDNWDATKEKYRPPVYTVHNK